MDKSASEGPQVWEFKTLTPPDCNVIRHASGR